MKTNLQEVRNAGCGQKAATAKWDVDLIKTPEAHGIELHEEELERIIAPLYIKMTS